MSLETLQQWSQEGKLSEAQLSTDGRSLTLDDATLDASQETDVSHDGKSCRYTLASIFLQVLDPNQGLMAYRNACKAHSVTDPVKALDKPIVVGSILGDQPDATVAPPEPAETEQEEAPEEKRPEKKHKHDKHESAARKHHRDHKHQASEKKKKRKVPMTNEQLFSNLSVVVEKRSATLDEQQEEIHKALSAEGFEVTPQLLEEHRAELEQIVPLEIPVGNSASILRPATAVERDFARVLQLYNETIKPASSSSKKKAAAPTAPDRSFLRGKKPVIVLPKGMSTPITMVNGYEFFAHAKFEPATKKSSKPPTTFTRKVASRLGGGLVEYELMDNPKSKLGQDPREWQRIVAVVALGASWQFKDWPGQYSQPVHLFSRTFGFYIGMEGDKMPPELEGWAVRKGKLNRDKRGLDSVTYASFWNGLDEWMSVHKPELLPEVNK